MNFPPPFLETNGLFGFLSRRLSHFLFDVKLLKKIFSVEEELFLNENFEVDLATWQRFCSQLSASHVRGSCSWSRWPLEVWGVLLSKFSVVLTLFKRQKLALPHGKFSNQ